MDIQPIFEIREPAEGEVQLPEGAKISIADLRTLRVTYFDLSGEMRQGLLVCNKKIAAELLEIFRELFAAGYRLDKIRLAGEYGGDDDLMMADDNTSCFNYRCVANKDMLSMHARGLAVDINPFYNPYIQNGVVMPPQAAAYADREADFEHKITHEDTCYKIFAWHGWKWGGDWQSSKDYQHFYKPESFKVRVKRRISRLFAGK